MKRRKARVEKACCVACGVCAKVCPREAVSIFKGCFADVNGTACVGCGICERNCPTGAIRLGDAADE